MKEMRRILSVSYYDLPAHLKTCLLFVSLYPEDCEIVAEDLIWQWIGEGFVHREQGKSLYEVGEDYFSELINKSLIQPVDIMSDNKASACRVHDMVLDLITSLSSEENFLTIVGGQQPLSASSKIRRLSIQSRNDEHFKQLATMNLSHVRSFNVFGQDISLLPALSSFPVLRALDLSYCSNVDNHLVKIICNMFHLRYLSLSNTFITLIPEEIGNLKFLQVLDISLTEIKVLPSAFLQLTQLVYLHIDKPTRLPQGFGDLKSLKDFRGINITSPTMLHDLGKLTELRNLHIIFDELNESYEEPLRWCQSDLVNLKTIKIYVTTDTICLSACLSTQGLVALFVGTVQVEDIQVFGSMPSVSNLVIWFMGLIQERHERLMIDGSNPVPLLSCLFTLEIQWLKTLGVEDLQVLGSMPSLSDLRIWVEEPTQDRHERLMIDSSYPFRCLTWLAYHCPTMELKFAQGAVQKLRTLVLPLSVQQTVDQFGDLDFGLENISSLEHVRVLTGLGGCKDMPVDEGAAEAAIQKALDMNPNKPTLEFIK